MRRTEAARGRRLKRGGEGRMQKGGVREVKRRQWLQLGGERRVREEGT